MDPREKESFIRQKAEQHTIPTKEKIMWSIHAVRKLRVEGLRKSEVEKALKNCIIIEDYPNLGRPLPDCLALGFIDTKPIHIVVAIDKEWDRLFIVTVYNPTKERWEDGWKKRKK